MLERAKSHEKISLLIARLDLVPTPSPEFVRGERISERVESWLQQIPMQPQRLRKITYPRKPWEEPDLSDIAPGSCPF